MKNLLKKLFGITEMEEAIAETRRQLEQVERTKQEVESKLKEVQDQEELAKLTAKERANRLKEPWVGVLNTHVNKENVRNGFFELDWNEYFVLKLKQEGYGADGDPEEEIVDRWFRELCANVVVDGDYGGPVQTGVIDIQSVKRNNK
jgi:hypothetical protein